MIETGALTATTVAQLLEELAWLEDLEAEYSANDQPMPDELNHRLLQLHARRDQLATLTQLAALNRATAAVVAAMPTFINAAYAVGEQAVTLAMTLGLVPNRARRRINKRRAIARHQARKAAR